MDEFADLLRRVRDGDEKAVAELARAYEPVIRREARLRLADPNLARLVDSADICQSVLLSFLLRVGAGQYDLERPDDLLRLLLRMVRNKVASHARTLRRRAPDSRRSPDGDRALDLPVRRGDPTRAVAARDLMSEVLRRLAPEERRIAECRARGHTWREVAQALGGAPEARRKQIARALDRVLEELGLEKTDP